MSELISRQEVIKKLEKQKEVEKVRCKVYAKGRLDALNRRYGQKSPLADNHDVGV